MNESRRGRLIIVAIAALITLTIEQGAKLLSSDMPGKALFYGVTIAGAGTLIAGTQVAAPLLSSGLFFGGIATVVRNYYRNWGNLDAKMLFLTLLLALCAMIFLSMHRSGRGGKRPQHRPHGGPSRPRRPSSSTGTQRPAPRGPRPPR